MPENDTNQTARGTLPYEAPTLTRIPVGETEAGAATNSDLVPFAANTAFPDQGNGGGS